MNKKSKILLSSIATIAMCASVATGATYALFTSESEVSIAVTSGTVDVRATASELSLYTDGGAQKGAFALGGTATKNGNIIKIERMMPMDSVNFDIVIENYSDVTVQYRTVISSVSDTGLFSALEVTFTEGETEQVFKGGYSYADWATLEPEDTDKDTAEAVKTINVNIEFPDGANQNGYQGKSCEIAVTVEAVQGNADVVNPVTKVADNNYLVNSEEGMMLISGLMKDFAPNEAKMFNLALTADMDMKGYDWASPNFYFTHFNGNGHTISNLNCVSNSSYAGQVGFAGYFGGGSLKNVTFENVTATGNQAGVIAGAFDGCEEISGVVIKGRNTVSYKNVNENEKASGVGAIFGVNGMYGIKTYTQASIVVDSGATIDVYYNDMQTQILDYYNFADKYAFASTNLNEALTDNGTVTAHGVWYQIISDGFALSSEGEYVITNVNGVKYFAQSVNNGTSYARKTVVLANDLDMADVTDFTPIGESGKYFSGTFDGKNHVISNFSSVNDIRYGNAFFAQCAGDVTIKNVTFDKAYVAKPNYGSGNSYAIVCGYTYGGATLENVHVTNSKVVGFGKVAALVAYSADSDRDVVTLKNCSVTNTTIAGTYNVATFVGLVTKLGNVVTTNCVSSNNVWEVGDKSYLTSYMVERDTGDTATSGIYWNYEGSTLYAGWGECYVAGQNGYVVNEMDGCTVSNRTAKYYAYSGEQLKGFLQLDDEVIDVTVMNSVDCYLSGGIGTTNTKEVNITGASKDVVLNITCGSDSYNGSYATFRTNNLDAVINFSNITLEKSKWTAQTWNTYNIEFYTAANITDCVITHPVTFCNGNTYTMTNTVIDSSNDTGNTFYSVWVEAGANVTITGCEIIGNRGVKADGQYVSYPGDSGYGADDHDETVTKLAISDTKFALTGSKSAVLVKLEKANVVLNNVTVENATTNNALVWIDEDAPMSHTEFAVSVTVDGTVCDNNNIIEP